MAYADVLAVKARAGKLSKAWGESTVPGEAEILTLLDQTAEEIDAILAGRGVEVPLASSSVAAKALEGLNADMALVLLIVGTWPGDRSSGGIEEALKDAQARRDLAWAALVNGTHAALSAIDVELGELGATDFWIAEPDYGLETRAERLTINPHLQPTAERGMKF